MSYCHIFKLSYTHTQKQPQPHQTGSHWNGLPAGGRLLFLRLWWYLWRWFGWALVRRWSIAGRSRGSRVAGGRSLWRIDFFIAYQ